MKIIEKVVFLLAIASIAHGDSRSSNCSLISPEAPIELSLEGLSSSVSFVGYQPLVTRIQSDVPLLKIIRYGSEPLVEVEAGKVIVSKQSCSADTVMPTSSPSSESSGGFKDYRSFLSTTMLALLGSCVINSKWMCVGAAAVSSASFLPFTEADANEVGTDCESVIEIEVHGPSKSAGAFYMEDMINWSTYDGADDSLHFTAEPSWTGNVDGARAFRASESGAEYNYRNKVLMGLAQTRILNEPPPPTPKSDVQFEIPSNVTLPETDEEIMMMSVLEMQALLRQGDITSTQLTNIALDMLKKYDPEYNILEVSLETLALRVASEADALFANGTYTSVIQGIPFAVKDTYDVAGYATAYGSFEFMDNVVESESPLVTYAVNALAVPLFKSTVPQLTWGTANYKGTVYSCLNGGYSAGTGSSGGSSIGSGNAVCLGVVPVAICEQTGSSCQSPAIANGISTVIPALGTFSRENNGLYSLESDRPGLLCRDIMSCAVFYNYMRGSSPGDPQSRDVPFADPSKEDISTYSIAFVDNSDTQGWPLGWDTPYKGQRGNVVEALENLGATVTTYETMEELMTPNQLFLDFQSSGVGDTLWWDWYFLNVEGFFESVQMYGGDKNPATGSPAVTYGPVWRGQNFNFDFGNQGNHIGATAYSVMEAQWLFGYTAEKGMYEMLSQLPDVVVHFAQSELNGVHGNGNLVKRAGINTVHIPEFYWNTTDEDIVDWNGTRPIDYFEGTTVSAAMITCESKKYEPVKAFAVCHQLQQALVENGKLISPFKDLIQEAIQSGEHDLDCPYDWSSKTSNYMDNYPEDVRARVEAKLGNIGRIPVCEVL